MPTSKLIVIIGPTASGKTELALELAKKFQGEIVNADSRQIYAGMVIGTASPFYEQSAKRKAQSAETRPKGRNDLRFAICDRPSINGIPHHLFHILKPDDYFSVADYKKLAIAKIRDITKRRKIPFLVGGTGLYVWAVVDNLDIPRVPPQNALRKILELRSTQELYDELNKKDPDAASLTGPNKRRIIRALEVIEATGKPFSKQRLTGKPLFETLQIGLRVPLPQLDKKIENRAHEMMRRGFLKEVQKLLKKYPPNLPAFSALGYRHSIQYLQDNLSLDQATEQVVRSHKQLARRQMRWFKRDKRIVWLPPASRAIPILIRKFLLQ